MPFRNPLNMITFAECAYNTHAYIHVLVCVCVCVCNSRDKQREETINLRRSGKGTWEGLEGRKGRER